MAQTAGGTYYAASSELVSSWPATSLDLANQLESRFAAKAPTASPTFTGNIVWSGATLRIGTAVVATSQSTSSGTYTDLATVGPAVTLTTGTKALVIVSSALWSSSGTLFACMSFAISGATTQAASDTRSLQNSGTGTTAAMQASRAFLVTGLTAGSNTFTCKYRTDSSALGVFLNRDITVIDMGS